MSDPLGHLIPAMRKDLLGHGIPFKTKKFKRKPFRQGVNCQIPNEGAYALPIPKQLKLRGWTEVVHKHDYPILMPVNLSTGQVLVPLSPTLSIVPGEIWMLLMKPCVNL
jgi:hypothetical protein